MTLWGIVISISALLFGLTGAVFVFWAWHRRNRGLTARAHFIVAIVCGILFGGLLYLGGRLGLLW